MKPTHTPAIPTDAVMIAVEPAELAGIESRSPEWDPARALLAGVYTTVRQSVAGWIFLGRELVKLKEEKGYGGRGGSGPARAGLKPWPDLCRSELGISDDMADRCMKAYKVIRHRGKMLLSDDSEEFRLLIAPPSSLAPADQKKLRDAIGKLIKDDDSQRSLLRELRMINAPFKLAGGDTSAAQTAEKQDSLALVASVKFRELFNDLGQINKEISRLRFQQDQEDKDKKPYVDSYLCILGLTTNDPAIIGLLDYQESFNRLRREIEEGMNALSEKIGIFIEAKHTGEAAELRRKKTNTRKK